MKRNLFFLLIFLVACNSSDKKNITEQLQQLGSLLPTANWKVIDGADTTYVYFSRQADNSYQTIEYHLVNGDSSVNKHGSIQPTGDSIIWAWKNYSLYLEEVSDSVSVWKDKSSRQNFTLQKLNSSSLELSKNENKWMFKKTLPLSTFLVRAKYDFEHGTNFLDSIEVAPKRILRRK